MPIGKNKGELIRSVVVGLLLLYIPVAIGWFSGSFDFMMEQYIKDAPQVRSNDARLDSLYSKVIPAYNSLIDDRDKDRVEHSKRMDIISRALMGNMEVIRKYNRVFYMNNVGTYFIEDNYRLYKVTMDTDRDRVTYKDYFGKEHIIK